MKRKFLLLTSTLFLSTAVSAEVVLDGTVGPKTELIGPQYSIGAELGQQRGSNLFHSFSNFSIATDEIATFSGPENVSRIISRVTGGQLSNIDGILRSTIRNADFYLLNPAGILFGRNASLDISGSFHATTSDTLHFADGQEFSARQTTTPLLTIANPSAFGFIGNSPASIAVNGSKLGVADGKTLSLIGGELKLDSASISAKTGYIHLASVGQAGKVVPTPTDLITPTLGKTIDIRNSLVTVSGNGGGGIYIRGGQFQLQNAGITSTTNGDKNGGTINVKADELLAQDGSKLAANSISKEANAGQAGQISISVKGTAEFVGERALKQGETTVINISGINASAYDGPSGNVSIQAKQLNLKDGAMISASTFGKGAGGNITIQTQESVTLSGNSTAYKQGSSILANARSTAAGAGKGGNISLDTKTLSIKDGGKITSLTLGAGNGGNINIKASETVVFEGHDSRGGNYFSGVQSTTNSSGNAGNVAIETKTLQLLNRAAIAVDSGGSGRGGNIAIKATDALTITGQSTDGNGSFIAANTSGKAADAGDGGTIAVETSRLSMKDGGQITTTTFGPGKGGTISITASKNTTISGRDDREHHSGIFSKTLSEENNAGIAGSIALSTSNLVLTDQAYIAADTNGPAKGGDIHIQAREVQVSQNASVTASSNKTGEAGEIVLTVGSKLKLQPGSSLATKAQTADGGNVSIYSPGYIYLSGSQLTTSVSEEFGGGGNIRLGVEFVVLDKGEIIAKAKRGKGGNISITTTGVYKFSAEPIEKLISAASEFGVDGEVTINTPDENADEGLLTLPESLLDAESLMKSPCSATTVEEISSLLVVGREGMPTSQHDLLPSTSFLADHVSSNTVTQMGQSRYTQVATLTPSLKKCRIKL